MAVPAIDISVDPATGVWTTDGLPMLYVPRHFLLGILDTVRGALGVAAADGQFYTAGYLAAERWCAAQAARLGLSGMAVFHFYMQRLSERGWGVFDGTGIDPATGTGRVLLSHSAFVADAGVTGRKVCGFCAGWAPGALAWVGRSQGHDWRLHGEEIRCASEGHGSCEIRVMPASEAQRDGGAPVMRRPGSA